VSLNMKPCSGRLIGSQWRVPGFPNLEYVPARGQC